MASELMLEFIKNAANSAGISDDEIKENLKRYNKENLNI